VVVGEPLEIRVNGSPLAVTMHTPGSDIELTQGFLFTENIIRDRADIASIRYCNSVDADGSKTYNVLDVELAPLRRPGGPERALIRPGYLCVTSASSMTPWV